MVIGLLVLILLAILFPGFLRMVCGIIALVLLFAFVKVSVGHAQETIYLPEYHCRTSKCSSFEDYYKSRASHWWPLLDFDLDKRCSTASSNYKQLINCMFPEEKRMSLPRYEVASNCIRQGGSNRIGENACVSAEQDAYDMLKIIWPDVPIEAQHRCDEQARTQPYRYQYLYNCVDVDLEIQRQDVKRVFHY